ncbi:hypothetical protein [Bacillus andreraoultii]|uniref:hypothetical protein n=1 Tax=Bacillus andreraoultii TaxID=1499685 RepID=UPI00053B9C6F|nr:hypothetical protein [Bacillus andreraoultii]
MNLSFTVSAMFMLLYWVVSLTGSYGSALVLFVLTIITMGIGIYQALAKTDTNDQHQLKLVK